VRLALALGGLLFAFGACGFSPRATAVDALVPDDPPPMPDGPPPPVSITISGIATNRPDKTPLEGATVELYATSDDLTVLATTTTDATGAYSLTTMITSPLDAYVKAYKNDPLNPADNNTNYVATYLYPPYPLARDYNHGRLAMLTRSIYGLLGVAASTTQHPQNGVIACVIYDSSDLDTAMPVAGATVASSPVSNPYCYNGKDMVTGLSSGVPNASTTATLEDGIAYMYNAPPGPVVVTANKSGVTFQSHTVGSWVGSFTTTTITE
jgi:hypothetical protein